MGTTVNSVQKAKKHSASKNAALLAGGMAILILALVISLMYGTKNFDFNTVLQAVFSYDAKDAAHQIIQDIRLPRALAAAMIGAFLAVSGCIMQTITRNPIAEPSLLGVSHGAAFALVLTLAFYPALPIAGTMAASIAGAGVAVIFVFSLALLSKGGSNTVKLALAGMALSVFLSSLTSAIGLYFNVAKDMSFWYAGSLASIDWRAVKLLAVLGFCGLFIAFFISRSLTVMHLGEDLSKGLGIRVGAVRALAVTAILLLTGCSVAVSGTIGFIGLVVPHICRMLVGVDHRILLPVSALFGAILLTLSDVGAKLVNPPYETPVGVVTALIGVPFFLYLASRGRGPSL